MLKLHRGGRRLRQLVLLVLCVYVAWRGVGAADIGVDLHAIVRGVVDVAERRSHGGLGGDDGDDDGRTVGRIRGSGRKAMRLFVAKYQDSHGRHRGQRRRGRGQRRGTCIFGRISVTGHISGGQLNIWERERGVYCISTAISSLLAAIQSEQGAVRALANGVPSLSRWPEKSHAITAVVLARPWPCRHRPFRTRR